MNHASNPLCFACQRRNVLADHDFVVNLYFRSNYRVSNQVTAVKSHLNENFSCPCHFSDLLLPSPLSGSAEMTSIGEFLWKNIKYISLLILVGQNAALVLTVRYSRMVSGDRMYLASTAVVLTELLKFIISTSMIFYNSNFDFVQTRELLYFEIIEKGYDTLKVSVPSLLYTVQNNLLYVALSHLNAVTFQVSSHPSHHF